MTAKNRLAYNNFKDFDKSPRYVPCEQKVGHLDSITLDACSECLGKVDDNDDTSEKSDLKLKGARNEEDARGD